MSLSLYHVCSSFERSEIIISIIASGLASLEGRSVFIENKLSVNSTTLATCIL